ncbi:MAG: hypothetical protein FJX52_16545 [Alphaproteobacteria bacterium]|nr:hypothetical protein [Alphaproteobacteria bacterium]
MNLVSNAPSLDRLLAAARAGQWRAADLLGPTDQPRVPRWLPRSALFSVATLLRHGEQAALAICRDIGATLPNGPVRDFVELQMTDEQRHTQLYIAYLERLAWPDESDDPFLPLREAAVDRRGDTDALVLLNHFVLEDAAVGAHLWLAHHLPCPLLRRITKQICRDQASHVAFGRWCMRQAGTNQPASTQRANLAWAREVRARCAASLNRHLGALGALLSTVTPHYAAAFCVNQDRMLDRLLTDDIDEQRDSPC